MRASSRPPRLAGYDILSKTLLLISHCKVLYKKQFKKKLSESLATT